MEFSLSFRACKVCINPNVKFPVVSSENFHFEILAQPVHRVAIYAQRIAAISLLLHDRKEIYFL